jgi:hypothetical protein
MGHSQELGMASFGVEWQVGIFSGLTRQIENKEDRQAIKSIKLPIANMILPFVFIPLRLTELRMVCKNFLFRDDLLITMVLE